MVCFADRRCCLGASVAAPLFLVATVSAFGQQTLGGITGTIVDVTGAAVPNATITAVDQGTKFTRSVASGSNGQYSLVNLPIGTYAVSFSHEGYSTEQVPNILVQADRTVTLPATLQIGAVSTSVTVEADPLLNAADTTNGYVLDRAQIQAVPLPTGSFTG